MMRSDEMLNILFAIFFIVLSLLTWMSVLFRIEGIFVDETAIFSNQRRAILFYCINLIIAVIMTIVCYIMVCALQRAI